jgi:predicted nuclease of predicted toxin-antitoxin system
MKLFFDQNISHKILRYLPETFSESTTAKHEGLINVQDKEIWEFAKINGYTIVTQDSDFNDFNSLHGFPPKVIWIRTGNLRTKQLSDILLNNQKEVKAFISDQKHGCLEILSIGVK